MGEILNLIESVSRGFPSYFFLFLRTYADHPVLQFLRPYADTPIMDEILPGFFLILSEKPLLQLCTAHTVNKVRFGSFR